MRHADDATTTVVTSRCFAALTYASLDVDSAPIYEQHCVIARAMCRLLTPALMRAARAQRRG